MPEAGALQGTLLGFDYGLKRIGVAVGQTMTCTATALSIVRSGKPDWEAISRLVEEWRPCAMVVGLPLDYEGGETEMSRAARNFAGQLRHRYSLPVFHADERLSSRDAETRFKELRASGGTRRKEIQSLDAVAAKIILENWLQSQSGTGTDRSGSD